MESPRQEYPRPQLVRERWLNLNGRWAFEFDPGRSGIQRGLPQAGRLRGEILVPFCPESRLSGIGDVDFHAGVWYRRTFRIPEGWEGSRVLLHIGAVDHDAFVWVNGRLAGRHRGGYTPISLDVTDYLARGENVLTVHAQDETRDPLVASGKQCPDYESRRCHYTRTTGIWQTVWLEPVPQTYLRSLRLTPDLRGGRLLVEARLGGRGGRGRLQARASLGGAPMGEAQVAVAGQTAYLVLPLAEVHPWGPGHPTLYDLALTLQGDGGPDEVSSYFGLRSTGIHGRALTLNDEVLFQRLVLDQGFYPDGIYTAPSNEALRNDIVISQGLGFNGARLHEKVFEPRFLYWADRLGYLVWGEFANWGLDVSRPEALEVFLPQWLEALERDYNHPSLVGWCPLNETQVDQDPEVVHNIYRVTKAVDATRPTIDTSGYQHVETDIYDVHDYNQDVATFRARYDALARGEEPFRNRPDHDCAYQDGQPYFVSEYGGIWWNPEQQDERGWGYGGVAGRPRTPEEFLARYEGLTKALLENPRICAFCYTQLYDVEQEVNGLYTYDRTPKFDSALLRRINAAPAAIEG